MTKLKISSKMHVMIIVSALVIAIGLAVGLVCQFVSDGYFNYGADYSSYDSVVVSYAYPEYPDEEVLKEICDKAFDAAGVKYLSCTHADNNLGGELVFKFGKNADETAIRSAADAIHAQLSEQQLSNAYYHTLTTERGNGKALVYGSIALAAAVAFQFLYFLVRYRLTMALSALLADVHNLAIFVSLLAITRVPVGSTVFAFGTIVVLMTMIGCCFLYGRMRKSLKNDSFAALNAMEQTDICAGESFASIAISAIAVAVTAVLLFVLLSISALSVSGVLTAVLSAIFCAVASVYGTSLFTPAVYSRFKRIGDQYKAVHAKKTVKKS